MWDNYGNKKKHRSISEKLRKARTREQQHAVLLEWINAWSDEQTKIVERLGRSSKNDDFDQLCIDIGELKAVTAKRFTGLKNVANTLFTSSLKD